MKEVILVKNGEITLKGLNRHIFEDLLIKNISNKLESLGKFKYYKAQSTIYVEPLSDKIDISLVVARLQQVFGIAGICRAYYAEKNIKAINQTAVNYLKNEAPFIKTFKVESKRSDKEFIYKSPEISALVGEFILNNIPHISVDVHNPDVILNIEVRDFASYIYSNQLNGAGGLPVGSSGKGMLMISGGIDSPVAGYMMAKRGMILSAIHFTSPPYTSEKAQLKVIKLIKRLSNYAGQIEMCIVNFSSFQEAIKQYCPEEFFTIIMRRYMTKISQLMALKLNCEILITGESLAQVASQTLHSLICVENVATIPIFRPLIGFDKLEIINIAKKIDTYATSILPYEDCCTIFTPKHPRTKPTIRMLEKVEKKLKEYDEKFIMEAIDSVKKLII